MGMDGELILSLLDCLVLCAHASDKYDGENVSRILVEYCVSASTVY